MVKLLENLLQSCLILNSEQRFTPEQVNSTHSSLFGHSSLAGPQARVCQDPRAMSVHH